MQENEEENKLESKEKEEKKEEKEVEVNSEEEEDDLDDDSLFGANKHIKKYQRKVNKHKKAAKQVVLNKLQILLAIVVVIAVLSWGKVETLLHKINGLTEVTIVQMGEKDCYRITTEEGEEYCVELDSYTMAEIGGTYLLEKTQYSHKLRVVE